MRYDNYLKRFLKPAAEAVGLGAVTHQMLRRSFSTMALDSGASPKDVQGQMRHTDARMSLYYGKVIPASVKQEVNKLVDGMRRGEGGGGDPKNQNKKSGENRAESGEISAQVRPWQHCGRKLLHLELFEMRGGQATGLEPVTSCV